MIKKKRTILQSIKKDILKGLKRSYFFLYTILKYNFISINALISQKKNKFLKFHYYYQQEKDLKNLKD